MQIVVLRLPIPVVARVADWVFFDEIGRDVVGRFGIGGMTSARASSSVWDSAVSEVDRVSPVDSELAALSVLS